MNDSVNNNQDNFINKNYKVQFPYSIKPIDPETNSQLLNDFTGKLLRFFLVI